MRKVGEDYRQKSGEDGDEKMGKQEGGGRGGVETGRVGRRREEGEVRGRGRGR